MVSLVGKIITQKKIKKISKKKLKNQMGNFHLVFFISHATKRFGLFLLLCGDLLPGL